MATTQNGIYYQDDYTKSADILADMKEMAESIDEVILEEKENQETIEQTIQQIQSNQTTQNQKIEQIDDNQIHITTEKSSNINVQDSSNLPAKINVFGISEQETRSGKNKLAVINASTTSNGVTITNNNDGSITLNGTATANIYYNLNADNNSKKYFTLIKNNTYGILLKNIVSGLNLVARSETKNYALLSLTNTEEKTMTYNYETDEQCFAYLQVNPGTKLNNVTVYPMIVEGTEIGEFEQYGASPSPKFPSEIENTEGDIDITDCNKNLFDKNKVTDNNYLNENGGLTANTLYCVSGFINVEENETYFLPTRGTSRTKFYDKNKQALTNTWDVADGDKSFVIPANAKYIRFSINKETVDINKFQFERNNVATGYMENEQQTITFPLQEGQKLMKKDYPADDGIHHKRKQIVLDGTENWVVDTQASPATCMGWKILVNDYVGYKGDFAPHGNILCSYFVDRNTYNNELDGISGGWGKWIFIKMKKEDLNSPDLTGFKAFLSEQKTNGTPVTIEYPLAEEIIEPYTEEQQEAYNQLQNAKTYKTVTNVFTENAELEMEYIADTKTYIDNEINNMKEQLNTINQLLSTTNTSALLLDNM